MSSGGGGGININMPTYEGSLQNALQSQVNLLRGSGQFEDIGSLQNLVEQYERPLRMSQAQIGTDVLRQTLLGGMVPIYQSVSQDEMMQLPEGSAEDGTLIDYGGTVTNDGRVVVGDGEVSELSRKVDTFVRALTSENNNLDGYSRLMGKIIKGDPNFPQGDEEINLSRYGIEGEDTLTANEATELFAAFWNISNTGASDEQKKSDSRVQKYGL